MGLDWAVDAMDFLPRMRRSGATQTTPGMEPEVNGTDLVESSSTLVKATSRTVRVFRQKFTLEDAIGSHACSLEALTCV
jgi:hypothetical protein